MRKFIRIQFKKLAYAPKHNEFQKMYEKFIKADCLQVINFLATVPPEHFANAYFPGWRYRDLCSTVAESFNFWIVEDRELPITSMIDSIWKRVMMKITENIKIASSWTTMLCPIMEKLAANYSSFQDNESYEV